MNPKHTKIYAGQSKIDRYEFETFEQLELFFIGNLTKWTLSGVKSKVIGKVILTFKKLKMFYTENKKEECGIRVDLDAKKAWRKNAGENEFPVSLESTLVQEAIAYGPELTKDQYDKF